KTGSTIGKTCIVPENTPLMTINPQLIVLKNIKINNRFLHYLISSDLFKLLFLIEQTGSTTPTISQEKINNFPVIIPNESEQKEIVSFLEFELDRISNLKGKLLESIEKLKQYKQSLISEAVTGKFDVRN